MLQNRSTSHRGARSYDLPSISVGRLEYTLCERSGHHRIQAVVGPVQHGSVELASSDRMSASLKSEASGVELASRRCSHEPVETPVSTWSLFGLSKGIHSASD